MFNWERDTFDSDVQPIPRHLTGCLDVQKTFSFPYPFSFEGPKKSHMKPSPVQSVIQPNQQSVIQTAANIQPILGKGNVILVSKPNSVIQTTQGSLQTLRVVEAPESDESYSEEESPKKRHDLLTRRPSYRYVTMFAEPKVEPNSSEADSELSSHSIPYHTVVQGGIGQGGGEDQARKREIRLLKNREAARECRRKKKEYIKCLENRVAVLENQNKALIDELKALKELYCQQKVE
ncbi:cyclic AMP response element-binding protein B-like isoform X14 [Euwallacea fornicatus]|uniref:cyclic AMP response element-binding protein B-like isoform X14 n=1 Tax=Euwallacea fornicatus TaxID=995702 RepID=UPI00338EBC01